jgi:hypothetical protein
MGHILIKFTKKVIMSILLGETSSCNSSSELGGRELKDKMMRSDFQWPKKPSGWINHFLEVKWLNN